MDKTLKLKGFYSVLNKLEILSNQNGKCSASLKVTKDLTNVIGGLHGGCSASIVDFVSSLTIRNLDGYRKHESRGINLIYAKAAKVGEEILIEAQIDKKDKRMVYLSAEIRNKLSNEILIKATSSVVLK